MRWGAPLAAGLTMLLLLVLEIFLRLKTSEAGILNMVAEGFNSAPTKAYVKSFALGLLLPFYCFSALVLWGMTLAWGSLWNKAWSKGWRAMEGFLMASSALLWAHTVLWWEVPMALWTLPGIRALPFWLAFLVLGLGSLAYPLYWGWKELVPRWKLLPTALGWVVLWTLVPMLPGWMPRWHSPTRGGDQPAEVVMIGLDGLRYEVGEAATRRWTGKTYAHAYTVIPATRMLWHLLWGGDPLYYTIGHAAPAMEEFGVGERVPLHLLEEAKAKGWKPRFYIDDGGTIGLAGRAEQWFDDTLMPARGWENFVNSNLSVNFPLFGAWENWGRAFPTTNPWAPLDGGLKEALRQGRGSKWVMFHSCLAHQPIFLKRWEMAQIPNWWTAIPHRLEPMAMRFQATPQRLAKWDRRGDPLRVYTIRMQSILDAWEPIWKEMGEDPFFRNATRILFSDHGERFYHVAEGVRLGGIHGYNLDPWEARILLKVAGPGFEPGSILDTKATVSLLGVRDAIWGRIKYGNTITAQAIEANHTAAPMRYHVVSNKEFTDEPGEYKQMVDKEIVQGSYIAPEGILFMKYNKSAAERAKEVSIALGEGDRMWVIKPLVKGGAHRFEYVGFELKAVTTLDQATYEKEKARVEGLMTPVVKENAPSSR